MATVVCIKAMSRWMSFDERYSFHYIFRDIRLAIVVCLPIQQYQIILDYALLFFSMIIALFWINYEVICIPLFADMFSVI
jgi:hypothetical protein